MHFPTKADIKRRLRNLARKWAIPGWVLLGLGWFRSMFSSWSELQFALEKLKPAAEIAVSAPGAVILGVLWLTIVALYPVRDTKIQDGALNVWAAWPELMAWQVACLWSGREPPNDDREALAIPDVRKVWDMLLQNIEREVLPCRTDIQGRRWLKREDLISFANRVHQHPAFLFQDG